MNLQVSGAGGSLAARGRHPAGVLAGIPRCAVTDLQGEQSVLAGDLQAVGQGVVQGLVVLQPGGGDPGASAGPGLECCLLSGWKLSFLFSRGNTEFSSPEPQAQRKKSLWSDIFGRESK